MFVNTAEKLNVKMINVLFACFSLLISESFQYLEEQEEVDFYNSSEKAINVALPQKSKSISEYIADVTAKIENGKETEGNNRAVFSYNCSSIDKLNEKVLHISANMKNDGLEISASSDCFSEETDLILTHYIFLLEEMCSGENKLISELKFATDEETELILNDFNATDAEYPKDKTVVELFEEQVEKTPDNTAIVFEDKNLTYAEFNAMANSLAHKLREIGVKPDDFVAVIADRSIEMIAGIYGIIKAGGAYVPIDPTYPEERSNFILEDCKPKALLKYTKENITINTEIPIIDLSDSNIWKNCLENPEHINNPDNLIYCIYTSGTTGKPKGVPNMHKGIVNLISWLQNEYTLNENDVILQKTTYVFDVSASEIFWWFKAGAKLAILKKNAEKEPEEIALEIEKYGVTVIDFVPSMLSVFMSMPEKYIKKISALRYVFAAGEALNAGLVKEFYATIKKYDGITILGNIYGPTEASVYSTYYNLAPDFDGKIVPIGKPVSNAQVYIMNESNLCGIGIPGELCIAGDGLSRGYLNRPELTTEKFVKNPFGEGRMYKSGDLAKWLPNGNIEYLGRIDDQVKIRGFRIELGEIESRIREIENIRDCAVIARSDSNGDKAIYAYFIGDTEIEISAVRDKLKENLPEYMIPAYMMQIETIPVTQNGKLNRKALPEISIKSVNEYVAPRSESEKKICEIFSEILNVEKVGIKDSFFELGGHSLRATRLVNRIEAEFGIRIAQNLIFSNPTPEQIAVLLEDSSEEYAYIPKVAEKEYYEMSPVQKRMYILDEMNSGLTYNLPEAIEMTGKIDFCKFQQTIDKMIMRHEALRTSFEVRNGEYVQKIHKNAECKIEVIDIKEAGNKSVKDLLKDFVKPFDLSKAPLLRVRIIKYDSEKNLVMFDMHHIVSDGMSELILMEEFVDIYNGETKENLRVQYKDYSEWFTTKNLSKQREYWLEHFDGAVPVVEMPLDYARPQKQSFSGNSIKCNLEEKITANIANLARKTGTTEYMIMLSALMIILSKYSRQDEIVVGTPISARTNKDVESMVGMFVNTMVMYGNPEGKKKYIEFLNEVKETCLKAYENQDYPFDELIEELNIKRDVSRNPLFDVMFVVQNNDSISKKPYGITDCKIVTESSESAMFDLTIEITGSDKHNIRLEYCTDLYKKESAEYILKHYIRILEQITEVPDMLISDIRTATDEETELILNNFNATKTEYPRDKTVVELFEEQVEKNPNHTALVFEDKKLTYTELNAKANSLAYKLREIGVKPDDFVAIIADRSIEIICGIYGIIKAGGAYVPIDPTYPEDRISFMLEDCKPKAVLKYTKENITINNEIPVIDLCDSEIWKGVIENPKNVNTPDNIIYCIYTSGTTGKPKGVAVEHHNVVKLVKNCDYTELNDKTVALQIGQLMFDASTFEVWGTALNGGTLHLINKETILNAVAFKKYMTENNINTLFITTALFNQFINEDKTIFNGLKHLMFGGEATSERHVEILRSQNTGIDFRNVYGPTETTTFATHYIIDKKAEKTPIGKPISNTNAYIVGSNNSLCGIGVPGELCIAGDGVARGYLNRPELTAEKFVKNPFGEGRMYRSGDLVRWLSDGNIEFLGRIDEQVKIRGFRIELGEIESRIREIENIRDCAVIVKNDSIGDKAIYAYFTGDAEVEISEIRNKLKENLPEYMIPAYMMQIESIPVTRNGKLDKKALPEISMKMTSEYVAPRNEIEKAICEVFEDILNVKNFSADGNFIEAGGDSIKAIRIVSKIREYGYELSVYDIMTYMVPNVISAYVKVNGVTVYSQEEVTGIIEDTPIIHQFAVWNLKVPHHFNQAEMISVDASMDMIQQALDELVKHHDMLRAVYRNSHLEVLAYQECRKVKAEYFNITDNINAEKSVAEICTKIQSEIDLYNGPLMKAAVFDINGNYKMMICIHHLIVDGVSWLILLDDFHSALEQLKKSETVKLPMKSASFKEWANLLNEYREHEMLHSEEVYWNNIINELPYASLNLTDNLKSQLETKIKTIVFDEEYTEKLLVQALNAYHTQINDIMLSALGMTVNKITGQCRIAVCMEGYGRYPIHKDINVDRTVGWFTNIYPVILDCNENAERSIINTKEMLRSVPNKGLGFGLLYNTEERNITDIYFNYIGEKENSCLADGFYAGKLVADENGILGNIAFDGYIAEKKLHFDVVFKSDGSEDNILSEFADVYEEELKYLIDYCSNKKETVKTASDYTAGQITEEELNEIMDMIEED